MHIFKDGRAPFLEFLRNLTPQVVLLSFVLVSGYRLQLTCCYPENIAQTIIFVCFSLLWGAATWANSSLFIERYLISVDRINRASRLLKKKGFIGFRNLGALLCYAWHKKRLIFIESIFVFLVVEFGLTIVVLSATSSANALFKALHD